jgi:uncharacterized membrane protein
MTTSEESGAHHLAADIEIVRPADQVWSLMADYRNDTSWRRGVSRMDPTPAGPVRVGTTTDEVMRLAGSTYRNLGEVTAVGPDLQFSWRTVEGADADGSRTVTPLGSGRCQVRMELTVRTKGLQRVIAPILVGMLRRNLTSDLVRLRTFADRTASEQRRGA